MGDAQSAHRDAEAAEERSGDARDDEQETGDKPLINNGQVSEISGKAESSIAEVNGLCEEQIPAEDFLSPEKDDSETEKPLEEETPLENVEISEKESPNEADADEDVPMEIIEMDAKQNDINESFRRFFSNIGLKLTVKSGSGDVASDDTDKEDPHRPEDIEDTTKETTSENPEENTDLNMAQETYDNDSTTCPTLTDVTPEDAPQNAEEKTTETKEEVESDYVDAEMPVEEDTQQDATPEEEPESPSGPEEAEVVSPIKRFFTTGIFSGLRKKKKLPEEETADKELEDLGKKEVVETAEQTEQDQKQDKEDIRDDVEAAAVETEHKELKGDKMPAAQIPDPLTIIVTEPEILSSQEKEKVQASPLKRLFSGSSLNKLPRKQRSRRSSDARMSDSGEHVSDKVILSTESVENQKGEVRAQSSAEEEEGAWASFKKLMTPKKLRKRPSISNEETKIKCLVEESKPVEGGQISDHSTEEGNKRKDSSVSWESVLCGSGRRRSRKTSDSEEETPQNNNDKNKQDTGSKGGAESGLESSHEVDESVSPSEGDAGSTWKSLKRLVTPKRKAKDEDESKDGVQSDSESTQDESSFSIKKLLPGRKKRKSTEKHDQVSSDEADKDVASEDEDSETPAIVPLSEFDIVETAVQIQTQVDIERRIPKEADHEVQRDLLDQKAEPVLQGVCLQAEANKVQDKEDALESKALTNPATNEESDDTESLSKPQLSDIPEEATPASVTEDAARDDTIAEDLIEITSEAITAPEPLDITQEDETEMISAVSQLSSESSKTSGNTTPVPAEYVVKETDALLYQVVETISISPKQVPVCSDDVRSNRVVVSVSHQIMDTIVKKGQTVLETHKGLDATDSNPDLDVEELEAVDRLTASAQTESISEVNDSVSTEIVSEVHTEEFDTADIALDDVHEVDVTHPEHSLKELESIDEISQLGECLSAASTDILPPGEERVLEEGSLVEAHLTGTEAEETRDEAMEQEVQSLTEKEDLIHNVTDQIQVEDKDEPPAEAKEKQELDPEEGSVQSPQKDIISEDIPAAETHEHKEETLPLTEVNVEPEKEDERETDVEEQEASEALQTSTLVSEEGSDQSPTEEVRSEDFPEAEPVTDQLKQTEECLAEVSVEPEEPKEDLLPLTEGNLEQVEASRTVEEVLEAEKASASASEPVEASKTGDIQEPEEVQAVKEATSDSDMGSIPSIEKEVVSEDVREQKTISDEPKEETKPCTEADSEDTSKTVGQQEILEAVETPASDSEVGSPQSFVKEVISEDIPVVETDKDEPKQDDEVEPEERLPEEAAKTEHVQEPEDIVTETKADEGTSMDVQEVLEDIEGGNAKEEILIADVPKPDVDHVIASVTNGIENEVVAQLDTSLETAEDQRSESIPQDVVVEPENCVLEVVDELQTLTAVSVSLVIEETSVQVLEKTVFTEQPPALCEDTAKVTNEPNHEVQLGAVQATVETEKESELPGTETTNAFEHAVVAQVVVCKDASVAIPDVLVQETSAIPEPSISKVASEQEFKDEIETSTPLLKDEADEKVEGGSVVVMMHVPSVESEDNHRIQVQVVDVDVKSAETIRDSVLEVGVTEDEEVIDVCHETVTKVEDLSATPEIEEELTNEELKVTIEEVVPHVKENLPEPESVVEQEGVNQPEAVKEVVQGEVEAPKAMEDNSETFRERQEEAPTVVSDVSAPEQVSKDLVPNQPESSDTAIIEEKQDLEETKVEQERCKAGVVVEEVKLDQIIHEEAQMIQSPFVTHGNAGIATPQNTGIISSTSNVIESPSSVSIEFKLNIQYRRASSQTPDVSEVRVQAVEEPVNQIQRDESEIQIKESAVQATEITEPAGASDPTERAVITTPPVLLDIHIQAMETVEALEEIKPTERGSSSVRVAETMQPVKQTEQRGVSQSQPVISVAGAQQVEEPVKAQEEEHEQDVWMDAEEDIQEETEETRKRRRQDLS
ncbi:A-kinase anchor protein 12-like [Trematomus bernacchii]|uniref:A-kinase anchor protein 12-like n=1 Tax=Trematomus bernacchii TaxID=40690 RepID=UPI00146E2CD3|nr:A-kinase anchor protein 12-like [Trematomus bernacchii]